MPLPPPFPPSSPFSDSDKKIHNGWGGDDANAELKVEEAATFDAAAESGALNDWAAPADAPAGDWGAPADTSAGDWGAPPEEPAPAPGQSLDADKPDGVRRKNRDQEEEEDNTLTFDQYLAQQKEKEIGLVPKLETRRANDGLQDDIWGSATRLEKGQDEPYFSGKVPIRPIRPMHS